jgi:two-component system cell cycle response regulator CtrA
MRVLIVEDDNEAAASLSFMLRGRGWIIHRCVTGEEAIFYIRRLSLDVALLDLGLPDMSGLKVLSSLPLSRTLVPIICVSGIAEIEIKVAAFRSGAADYVIKPVHPDEIVARILAVVRRRHGRAHDVVTVGDWRLNLSDGQLSYRHSAIELRPLERMILMRLGSQPGKIFSNDDILSHMYGEGNEPNSHALSVYIHKLRRKCSTAADGETPIECVYRQGYRLAVNRDTSPQTKDTLDQDWFHRLGLDNAAVSGDAP